MLTVNGTISEIKLQGVWKCTLLDNTGRTTVIRPDYLEKADIQSEPPQRETRPLSLSGTLSVETPSLRDHVKKGVKNVFAERGSSAGGEKSDPPPYYPVQR